MPDFSSRSTLDELMDDPSISAAEMRSTLEELERINLRLGGYKPTTAGIEQLVPEDRRTFSVLDVGGGGGDVGRQVVSWARRRGLRVEWTLIDISEAIVEFAREKCSEFEEIECRLEDLAKLEESSAFDIVHGSLVLHHFTAERASWALERMFRLARWGVVINDLHRHPLAYWSILGLTRLLSRSRLICNDAPLSVLRSFVRSDWGELASTAGLPPPEVRWRWAFRWQVVIRKLAVEEEVLRGLVMETGAAIP